MKGGVLAIGLLLSALLSESATFGAVQEGATAEEKRPTKPESAGQEPLTNDSIVMLVKEGLPEDAIINLVNTRPERFSFAASAIATLQKAGVSEKIIRAMVNRDLRGPTAATAEPKAQHLNQTSEVAAGQSNPRTVTEAAQAPPAQESLRTIP